MLSLSSISVTVEWPNCTSWRGWLVWPTKEGRFKCTQTNLQKVLSKVFRLVPQTVLLVSDVGTIATANEGVFTDVDAVYTWMVEGDRATGFAGNGSSSAVAGPSQTQQRPSLRLKQKPGSECWKPLNHICQLPYSYKHLTSSALDRWVQLCVEGVCVCVWAYVYLCLRWLGGTGGEYIIYGGTFWLWVHSVQVKFVPPKNLPAPFPPQGIFLYF